MKRLTALCPDVETSQRVIAALHQMGVAESDVSVLVVDHGSVVSADVEHKSLVAEGATIGAATGAAVGLGLVALGGLPGLFAAGPVLAVLQGLGGGASSGFILGALAGLGWWKSEADIPTELLENDGVLVGIPISEERESEAREAAARAGAARVYVH
jgi:hypothetical protein